MTLLDHFFETTQELNELPMDKQLNQKVATSIVNKSEEVSITNESNGSEESNESEEVVITENPETDKNGESIELDKSHYVTESDTYLSFFKDIFVKIHAIFFKQGIKDVKVTLDMQKIIMILTDTANHQRSEIRSIRRMCISI